jgi:hypothetical protein
VTGGSGGAVAGVTGVTETEAGDPVGAGSGAGAVAGGCVAGGCVAGGCAAGCAGCAGCAGSDAGTAGVTDTAAFDGADSPAGATATTTTGFAAVAAEAAGCTSAVGVVDDTETSGLGWFGGGTSEDLLELVLRTRTTLHVRFAFLVMHFETDFVRDCATNFVAASDRIAG